MSVPKIVLGAGPIGDAVDPQAKLNTPEAAQAFLDLFRKYGFKDIDTARGYSPGAPGSCEVLLGQTDFAQWAIIDTKVKSWQPRTHTKEMIAESVEESLEALKVDKVHIEYLHAPDRETPFAETCEAINEAYKAGKLEKFGLSNFSPEEVEEVVELCEKNGWVKPTVYQGQYNAIARLGEDALLPMLRKHGLSFYAYSPSGGGIFSRTVKGKDKADVKGGRFDKDQFIGRLYGSQYLKDELLDAAGRVHDEAEKDGLTGHAVALRWVLHHSALDAAHGDAMILGASSMKQLEENLEITKAGPLPKHLVELVEDVWQPAKPFAPFAHI
ncbi:hypothetical protein MMC19_005441 [Ptychographa xylographoides]|nr:hypothetical protein [Ptychographa xylographoides]